MGNAAGLKSPHIVARRVLPEIREVPEKDADMLGRDLHRLAGFRIDDAPACRLALLDQPFYKSRNRIGRAFLNRLGAEIAFTVRCRHGQRYHRWLAFDGRTPARE